MIYSQKEESDWNPVSSNYLVGLSRRSVREQRHRKSRRRALGMLAVVLVAGWGGAALWLPLQADLKQPTAFACSDVQRHMQAYVEGTLEQPFKALFEEHLKICPRCRELLGKFQVSNDHVQVRHEFVAVRRHNPLKGHALLLAKR